jgi:hypothetical protein
MSATQVFLYIGYALLSLYVLWIYYLAVMALRRAKINGTVKPGWFQSIVLATVVFPGVFFDWLANFTIATVLFLELPGSWGELVTGRLKRHCKKPTWRGAIARFVCHELLDRFDPAGRHC